MIVVASLLRGDPILTTLQFALVLTVAAIPVAMPTVLSVTMAVGARLLAKKQAIVSRLVAIEELAGVDVLCADKTGTLTQNSLTLGDPFTIDNVTPATVILDGALASRADNDDPIDLAVLGGLADSHGPAGLHGHPLPTLRPGAQTHRGHRHRPRRNHLHGHQGRPAGHPGAGRQRRADHTRRRQGGQRFRRPRLPVPRRGPRRRGRRLAVRRCAAAVRPAARRRRVHHRHRRADGRHASRWSPATRWPSRRKPPPKVGLGTNILDATGLGEVKKSESAAVAESIETADGFAQVFPEHKYHIVDVLQKRGHIVGMTGDGVNDAPALKKADCGIAVSGATDAARAAADIVLLTPGLSVIIDAIKESRKIFQRMNSYAIYRIAETLRVLLFVTLAILVFNFYPLTAIMIVMLALLNDGAILSIAYDNVHYDNQPEAWNMRLVLGIATVLGVVGPIAAFGLFYLGDRVFDLGHPRAADPDVPDAVRRRAPHHLPDPHPRTVLVHPPRPHPADRRPRHPGHRDPDRRLRAVHDPARLEVGGVRLGLRPGLVPAQRPHQTPRLPHPRPGENPGGPEPKGPLSSVMCEVGRSLAMDR